MAAAMVMPKLYASSNDITVITTSSLLRKYRHLINLKENASILEFGFAEGGNSEKSLRPLVPSNYKEYFAADISKPMVEFAKKNVILPRGEFVQLDIATKNLPKEFVKRFDNIFSFYTLKINVAKQAFKNIHTMLKSRGETFQIFFKSLPVEDTFKAMSRHPKWGKYGHEMMILSHANPRTVFEGAVKNAGFKDIHFEEEDIIYTFPSEQAWKDLYLSVNPVVANIPANQLEDYKIDYFSEIQKYTLRQNDDGSKAKVDYTLLVVAAKK